MKAATLDKRVAALEQRRVYRIESLADFVVLMAWQQSGDPRTPRPEDVECDPVFADIYDRCTKRTREDEVLST
jgi:hypothetical protein